MPPNTLYVGRGTMFGNPYIVRPNLPMGQSLGGDFVAVLTREDAVAAFRRELEHPENADLIEKAKRLLAGHDLCCWCKLEDPCHADVWLEIANT